MGDVRQGEALQTQADRVLSEVLEHFKNRIAMEATEGDYLMKIRSCKASKKPIVIRMTLRRRTKPDRAEAINEK